MVQDCIGQNMKVALQLQDMKKQVSWRVPTNGKGVLYTDMNAVNAVA